ncbi:glutathione S-transferase family protein [Komagataeibacter xylinus]|uniref:glutathione S-transferase family protein n=1 Tax=Komagataeibacter xylinus TaxID=28448 RepID=UPI00280C0FBC|nr:glutathione S-transferase family protein [Komagataeibacter xylinus]
MNLKRSDLTPIELYGANTGNCLRVSIALEEAGIPYIVKLMDLRRGDQHRPEHLARNPMGRVPTIVSQDRDGQTLVLSQSNAILFYICDLTPGVLLPVDDIIGRARVLERFFFALTDVIGPSHSAFALRQINAGDSSAERLDRRSVEALTRAEAFLKEARFIGGEDFTLADIAAFTITIALRRLIDWPSLPHMQRWFDELHARPSIANGLRAFGHR